MNLIKLEMMEATERLVEALKTRGIFCSINNDLIFLRTKNTDSDIKRTNILLAKLNLSVLWLADCPFKGIRGFC